MILLLMVSGCTSISNTPPSWLNSLYDKSCDKDSYLCAIGSGSSREKAIDSALASLSQVFNSQVKSVTSVISISTAEMGGMFSESSEMFDQSSVTSSTDKIIGAEVVNTYIDSTQRVFVRVALNREEAANIYKEEIAELDLSILEVERRILTLHDDLTRYFTLSKAVGYARKQQLLYNQIQVLLNQSQESRLASLERKLINLASSVKISIEIDSSQGGEVLKAAFSQKLNNLGFTIVNDVGEANAFLFVKCDIVPLNIEDSPYKYATYTMWAKMMSGGTTLYSYNTSEREAALSDEDAMKKALNRVSSVAVDEFFHLLEESLGGL